MTLDFSSHPFTFADARDQFQSLRAIGLRAIDGDTVVAIVDLGFSIYMSMHLRLSGINTPEIVGTSGAERERALELNESYAAMARERLGLDTEAAS